MVDEAVLFWSGVNTDSPRKYLCVPSLCGKLTRENAFKWTFILNFNSTALLGPAMGLSTSGSPSSGYSVRGGGSEVCYPVLVLP